MGHAVLPVTVRSAVGAIRALAGREESIAWSPIEDFAQDTHSVLDTDFYHSLLRLEKLANSYDLDELIVTNITIEK